MQMIMIDYIVKAALADEEAVSDFVKRGCLKYYERTVKTLDESEQHSLVYFVLDLPIKEQISFLLVNYIKVKLFAFSKNTPLRGVFEDFFSDQFNESVIIDACEKFYGHDLEDYFEEERTVAVDQYMIRHFKQRFKVDFEEKNTGIGSED